jgi:hypothetical protein
VGDNKVISIICIALVIIGVVVLYVSSTVPVTRSLDNTMLGKRVMLQGIVSDKKIVKTNVFMSVGNDSVVFFSPQNLAPYSVLENQRVCVSGTVALYRDSLELIGNSLESC